MVFWIEGVFLRIEFLYLIFISFIKLTIFGRGGVIAFNVSVSSYCSYELENAAFTYCSNSIKILVIRVWFSMWYSMSGCKFWKRDNTGEVLRRSANSPSSASLSGSYASSKRFSLVMFSNWGSSIVKSTIGMDDPCSLGPAVFWGLGTTNAVGFSNTVATAWSSSALRCARKTRSRLRRPARWRFFLIGWQEEFWLKWLHGEKGRELNKAKREGRMERFLRQFSLKEFSKEYNVKEKVKAGKRKEEKWKSRSGERLAGTSFFHKSNKRK